MSDHCKHCRAALEAPTRRQLMTGAAALVAASALSVGRAKAATDPIVTPQNDSRVSPELLFDQSPGDVFVVRLAGNFLDDDGFASLEYAVKFLGPSS